MIQTSGVSQERIASISAKLDSVSRDDSKPSNIKKLDVESDDALNKELDAVTNLLKNEDWSKRADGLQRLTAIASGNAPTAFSKTFVNRLCDELKSLVAAQVLFFQFGHLFPSFYLSFVYIYDIVIIYSLCQWLYTYKSIE